MEDMNKNNVVETEKELEDPMVFDSENEFAKKKVTWEDIFLMCPDFADSIIEIFNKHGSKSLSNLTITLANNKFSIRNKDSDGKVSISYVDA